jgi:hypothetical protein
MCTKSLRKPEAPANAEMQRDRLLICGGDPPPLANGIEFPTRTGSRSCLWKKPWPVGSTGTHCGNISTRNPRPKFSQCGRLRYTARRLRRSQLREPPVVNLIPTRLGRGESFGCEVRTWRTGKRAVCNLYSVTTSLEVMRRLARAFRDSLGNQPSLPANTLKVVAEGDESTTVVFLSVSYR